MKPRPTDDAAPTGGGHSLFGKCLYAVLWVLCRTLGVSLFGFRSRFAEPLPAHGGLIVLSSHQSHLDPLLLGLATDRRLSSLARSSLYTFKPFGAVITALDAVPIDRNASVIAAMKIVIERLKRGAAVIIFPEGARTFDGRLGDFKSGFSLMAKRAGVPVVPVAIVGAFECWPRTRLFPRPGRIRVEFGKILTTEEVATMSEREIFEVCTQRIRDLDARARATLS
ncbi:MAG: 1-acyl-sn-glycerol-3-phosphate acyltransferase [Planctomycetia bacterium]|nr:1-acyl-sn-glycerol-3-phosphate acyltransferase [Planctomycetia bacterium]